MLPSIFCKRRLELKQRFFFLIKWMHTCLTSMHLIDVKLSTYPQIPHVYRFVAFVTCAFVSASLGKG